jgi:hypothetical protein
MPFMPPTNTKYVVDGRVMGGTMFRKVAKRTKPWLLPAVGEAEENSALQPLQQLEEDEGEEDVPPAKRPRLQASVSISNAAAAAGVVQEHTRIEKVTTDDMPTDDIPTDPVTPVASLVSEVTSRAPPRNWNGEEDTQLTEAVKKYAKNWVSVAAMVLGRTDKQCRNRWTQVIDPVAAGKTKGIWKPEEDTKLIGAMEEHGKNWVAVAVMVPGRTNQQCRQRWFLALDPVAAGNTKGIWKPEEDTQLTEAVKKHGKNWVAVAAMVPGRTDDQCRRRWTQTLDTAGKIVGRWKPEEDEKLIDAVRKHGKKWVTVATLVPGRTEKQCRSRWTQALDPVITGKTAGRWKPEEDAKLIEAVKRHGENWVAIAVMVSGRTNQQCRQRWTFGSCC